MPDPIRVAIVSGDLMFREILTLLFTGSGGLEVVACADDPQAAAPDREGDGGIDVVLVDAGYDPKLALTHVRAARDRWETAAAVVAGLDREDESVVEFVEAGGPASLLPNRPPPGLVPPLPEV